jgi:hypothetical protein
MSDAHPLETTLTEPTDLPPEPDRPDQSADMHTMFFGGVVGLALLYHLHEQQQSTRELAELLASGGPPEPPKPLPPPEPEPVEVTSRPWGVTERPERITWDFCHRFIWRTWSDDQKRIVPSASSRSQYTRIGKLLPEYWGVQLDQAGASFEKLRWIAASEDAWEREVRFKRVLAGEDMKSLKRPTATAIPEETIVAFEDELTRIAGRKIRVPRDRLEAASPAPEEAPKKRGRPRGARTRSRGRSGASL